MKDLKDMKLLIFILMFATSIYGQQFPAPYLNDEAQMLTHDPDMAQTWELAWCYAGFEYRGNWNLMTYELNKRSEERRVGKECRSRWSPYH